MNKFLKITLLSVVSLTVAGAGYTWWQITKELARRKSCAFCDPQVLETHTFYEDPLVMGLCSYKPVEPGHCLAIIKRHVKTFENATDEEISAIGKLLKKINTATQKIYGPSAYMILEKNGREAGQTVPHVHFHYIPKKKTISKAIPVLGLLWDLIKTTFKRQISNEKLAQNVTLMKKTFKELGYPITNRGTPLSTNSSKSNINHVPRFVSP